MSTIHVHHRLALAALDLLARIIAARAAAFGGLDVLAIQYGGGAGTTWLVGSADDVARSLRKYRDLGISHFILSDTPTLLPLLRD